MGFFSSIGNIVNDVLGTSSAMKAQNQQQWAMWNAQNAYNTPAEQMQRLKEAGLNPMLVYGHGSTVGNTAGSMSAASGGSGAGAGMLSSLAKSPWAIKKMNQDIALGQSQINQVKANNALLQAQAIKTRADALSSLYNLDLAKKRGTRDGQLTGFEGAAVAAEKAVDSFTSKRLNRKLENDKFSRKFFDWW